MKNLYPIATEFQGNGSIDSGYSDRGIESWHKMWRIINRILFLQLN